MVALGSGQGQGVTWGEKGKGKKLGNQLGQ